VLDGGRWLTPHPGHFTPGKEERDLVPVVQEAGLAPLGLGAGVDGCRKSCPQLQTLQSIVSCYTNYTNLPYQTFFSWNIFCSLCLKALILIGLSFSCIYHTWFSVKGNIVCMCFNTAYLSVVVPLATISAINLVFQCHITVYKMFEFFVENLLVQVHVDCQGSL